MRLLYSALFKSGSQAAGKDGPVLLTSAKELSSFGYFQRSSIAEMFTFFSRTFANNKSLTPGARTSVKHEGFLCHMYVSPAGVIAVCFADAEYPARVAFGYLSKLCEDFSQAVGGQLPSSTEDNCMGAAFQVRGSLSHHTSYLVPRAAWHHEHDLNHSFCIARGTRPKRGRRHIPSCSRNFRIQSRRIS